jgi:RimJ/RimL family protein N-acetyltransferase
MQPDGVPEVLERRIGNTTLHTEGDILELAAELRSTGEFVGAMTFSYRSVDHRRGEIGYIVAPKFTGQGFAKESATELLRIGFERVGLHRIEGQCDARNLASATVMERIGMRREALLRENEFVKDE